MRKPRYHIIIDLIDVSDDVLTNTQKLEQFLAELPGKIDMSILYGPVVKEGIPENPGLSGFVIIDYSHISIHTFSDSKEIFVDIFSCKPYSQEEALQLVLDYCQAHKDQARTQVVYWGE